MKAIHTIVRASMLVIPVLLLSNCATIFGGASKKAVSINSNPSGANVTVTDGKGAVVHQGVTPTSVALEPGGGYFQPGNYTMTFTKKGSPTQVIKFTAHMNGWYIGNLVFGGLLGLVIVDPLTGAMWALDDSCTATLGGTASNGTQHSLRVVERSQIPKEWEKHLVALN